MISTPAKGESVALHISKSEKGRIQAGISWDTTQEEQTKGFWIFKKNVMVDIIFDIDLFCCLYNKNGEVIDHVTPENANLMDESGQIFHSGDNQTGRTSGDDEYISVNTTLLPDNINAVVFFALCHDNKSFKQILNPQIRIADGASDESQILINLDQLNGAYNDGFIFAALIRDPSKENGWALKNISEFKNDKDVEDWGAEGARYLS